MQRNPIDECRQQLQILYASLETIKEEVHHPSTNTVESENLLRSCIEDSYQAAANLTSEINDRMAPLYGKNGLLEPNAVPVRIPDKFCDAVSKQAYTACHYWLSEEPHIDVGVLNLSQLRVGFQRLLDFTHKSRTRFFSVAAQVHQYGLLGIDNSVADTVIQLALFDEIRYG